jgi:hypothetical protein
MEKKLKIELVPRTAWYTNIRSILTKNEWDIVRHACYKNAGHVCEICGDVGTNQGRRHKVECHEIWEYNDETRVQKLTGFISLCPNCHMVKHAGLAISQNKGKQVIDHLVRINGCHINEAVEDITDALEMFVIRSGTKWYTDMEYLTQFMEEHGITRPTIKTVLQQRELHQNIGNFHGD